MRPDQPIVLKPEHGRGADANSDTVPAQDGEPLAEAEPQDAGEVVDGRYVLIGELGHGGMGVVYLAEDERLGRRVAIKFLRPNATDTDLLRFRAEARVLASFSHPNVVRVFDLGEHDSRPYFVMEYLNGRTLAEFLHDTGGEGLPVDVAIGFSRQLCEALTAVHHEGLIHRDIKPGNVIVVAGNNAVLMDFGLARRHVSAQDRTLVSGTPQYLPPEDIRGEPLDGDEARRSDIYALGITLYELIAGHPPFTDDNPAIVLHRQLHEAPAPLCDLRPDVPAAFEAVIMRALSKDPMERQATCDELTAELSQARARVVQPNARSVSAGYAVVVPPQTMELPAVSPSAPAPTPQRPAPVSPATPPRAAQVPPAPARSAPASSKKRARVLTPPRLLLITESDDVKRELWPILRDAAGLGDVKVLPDGDGGLRDPLASSRPTAAVIDFDLLGESPMELCAALRAQADTAQIPIFVLAEDIGAAEEAMLARMGVQIIPRPVDPAWLAARLQDEPS